MDNRIKDMVEKVYGNHLEIGMITIEPNTGDKVKIVDGQFWGTHGLSNFWYWQNVNEDGSLDPEIKHGYGWSHVKQDL